jgi:hypothetical protein
MIIVNETAYENAIARNIRMNAAKTRSAKWMALDGAKRINDFLFEVGEFVTVKATVTEHGERDGVKQTKIARPA